MDALLERVSALESRLNSEAAEKSRMAEEVITLINLIFIISNYYLLIKVEALREENVRLQEESATSQQQLKRFTEWFFQTIDKNGS